MQMDACSVDAKWVKNLLPYTVCMKKSQLKILLSKLDAVDDPDVQLEQYQTPPDIAAELLHQAALAGGLDGTVTDLGCGNGILALGAAVLSAEQVYATDIDEEAVAVAKKNKKLLEEELDRELPVTFAAQHVQHVEQDVDTVVMNPPFGLQRGNEKANKRFLEKAFDIAGTVYALLHQSADKRDETRDHLRTFADQHAFDTQILKWFPFPLPAAYSFHEKEREEIKVDLYRFATQ
jgi:putative methylase